MSEQTVADMDGGWKQMIEDYLEEFFRFFFPDVHASINFQAGHKFLDKELAKVLVDTETGDRRADKLIQLRKIQAGRDVQQRYRFKLAFIRELYSRGSEQDDILKLFRFMDYILRLPDDLASRFRSELESIEEKLSMPYVTSVERLAKQEGIEQGFERGIEQGLQSIRDLLLQTIQIRFGQIPDPLRASINACTSTEQLSAFHRQALLANSLDDLPNQL